MSGPDERPQAEYLAGLDACTAARRLGSILRAAALVVDEFPPDQTGKVAELVDQMDAILAAAQAFNAHVEAYLNART